MGQNEDQHPLEGEGDVECGEQLLGDGEGSAIDQLLTRWKCYKVQERFRAAVEKLKKGLGSRDEQDKEAPKVYM